MTQTFSNMKVASWLKRHKPTMHVIALGVVLGTVVSLQPEIAPQAHFLQRPTVQSSSSSAARIRPSALSRRLERLQKRKQMTVIRTVTTVAQNTPEPIKIADTELHTAAPSDRPDDSFPVFDHAVHPVSRVPNWGAMKSPAEWNRSYAQIPLEETVRVPTYDMSVLTFPLQTLLTDRDDAQNIKALTAKLYYSTRFFGAYDLDSAEFESGHPGIDLKLAEKTPLGAVAGGRVHDVRRNEEALGLHVIIEHRAPDGETYYSIYGHLDSVSVAPGDTVSAGEAIGKVGMSGHTSGPHVHLQIDRGEPDEDSHEVYWPSAIPSPAEANLHTINPMVFIEKYNQ